MDKDRLLILPDVGDAIFRTIEAYLGNLGRDVGVEMSVTGTALQEGLTVFLPGGSSLFFKVFPHKSLKNETVFRIEVYETKTGDLRGNRIGFIEIFRTLEALPEIPPFVEGVLTRSILENFRNDSPSSPPTV